MALVCVPAHPCGSAHARHMHIPVPYHADCCIARRGAVGTAETTRWLISLVCARTQDKITAEFFPELIHGCWDESEMIGCGSPNWGSSRPCSWLARVIISIT
uniref:Uncharacterized protein n=1 Tax=Oryza rufipogon TaxID=4529 RepID=A0A0E0N6P3_ORYRU